MAAAIQKAWDAAYSTYQGWAMLNEVDAQMGMLAKANWDFGASPKKEDDYRTLSEAEIEHLNKFGEPAMVAVATLVATPAPSIDTVREKMKLVTFWSLEDQDLPKPAVELIADDIERLTGIRAEV